VTELLSVRELEVEFATDQGVARVLDRISLGIAPGEIIIYRNNVHTISIQRIQVGR